MDFSKFRESGDLSDITISVDDVEFKVHKFPLYAKSEYFRNLTKQKNSKDKVIKLEGFPGGAEMFSLVADFCYNMPLPLTKTNVVQIRCAASFLQMEGTGNLCEIADKFLQDTITSAKMSRSIQSIVTLLLNCGQIGVLAEQTNIVSLCVDALIECWLKPPTKFNSFSPKKDLSEDKTNSLYSLPVECFVKILIKAQEEGVRMSELATLAVQYISNVINDKPILDSVQEVSEEKPEVTKDSGTEKEAEVAAILDTVLLALPEGSYTLPYITPDWLTKVLKIATTHSCTCRHVLIKVASEMLNTLSAEDLCCISPAVIHDIVVQAVDDVKQCEQACKLVDTYTSKMAEQGVLTSQTFKLLMSALPTNGGTDYNNVYDVLEYVLNTENDSLSKEETTDLIDLVNFSKLNEVTLQKAYDSEKIPKTYVAVGSLALCHRLREELDNYKYRAIVNGDNDNSSRQLRATRIGVHEPRPSKNTTSLDGEEAIKAATDVLVAARNKLSGPLYSHYQRQYYPHAAGASHVHNPLNSSMDDDTSFDEDFDYNRTYDRSYPYRNVESRPRPRSYGYSNHSTYFPYTSSSRY